MRRVIIMGAGGRDFHDFNVAFRDDPATEVVAFTAAQIPGIDDRGLPRRRWPARATRTASRSGPRTSSTDLIREHDVDEVVLAYSDLAHVDVMHKASIVLAAGADFRLMGPNATMLRADEAGGRGHARSAPAAARARRAARSAGYLLDAGLRVALVRHPMPYGDLEAMRVQRFATLERHRRVRTRRSRSARSTSAPVGHGHGHVRRRRLRRDPRPRRGRRPTSSSGTAATTTSPSIAPDLLIVVVDPLRPGHELRYHPGETEPADGRRRRGQQGRQRDAHEQIERCSRTSRALEPDRDRRASRASPVHPRRRARSLAGKRVLVDRRRPDDHPRRHAVRRRARSPRARRAPRARRPAAVRGRLDRRDARASYPHIDERGARDGLLRRSSCATSRRRSTPPSATSSSPARRCDLARLIDVAPPDPRTSATSWRRSASPTLRDLLAPIVERARRPVPA